MATRTLSVDLSIVSNKGTTLMFRSQDGEIDPADVHVDGVPTIAEERQMEEEKR